MKKNIYKISFALLFFCVACKKDTTIKGLDAVHILDQSIDGKKNKLDSLVDSIYQKYGVKVLYRFDTRVLDPITFYTPASVNGAYLYTKYLVEKMWLEPLAKHFPQFLHYQKPVEFLILGSGVHFNSISSGGAAGAGLNAQFYRLGMGGVNNFSYSRTSMREEICVIFHEHAHQMDKKYGRTEAYDKISAGDYYQLNYSSYTTSQAQKDGFFRAYGGYAPEEDFATSVEAMIRFPKDVILEIVAKNPKLEKKYKLVHGFYLNLGIDLHEIHDILDTVIDQFPSNFLVKPSY